MTTVDELRDVLQGQRTRVADLRERVQDKYLRDCLVSAAGVLDIVRLSISPTTLAEPRFASLAHGGSSKQRSCLAARLHRSISLTTT
jgi:hypothetical protein